jgi:hypothetical protein
VKQTPRTRLVVLVAVIAAVSTGCGDGAGAVRGQHANFAGVRCPRQVPELTSHKGVRPGVVISGPAAALVLCRYSGERLLKKRRLSSRAEIARIIHEINALPPFPKGKVNCPAATGGEVVILPLRAGRNIGTVEVELGGCFEVTNGVAMKIAPGEHPRTEGVFRVLEALVPGAA